MGTPNVTLDRRQRGGDRAPEPIPLTSLSVAQQRVVLALLEADRVGRASDPRKPGTTAVHTATGTAEESDAPPASW
jgi:hypothetical protein